MVYSLAVISSAISGAHLAVIWRAVHVTEARAQEVKHHVPAGYRAVGWLVGVITGAVM